MENKNWISWGTGLLVFVILRNCSIANEPHYKTVITGREPVRESMLGMGCECSYDYDINGSPCGYRSADMRPGGKEPNCYYYYVKRVRLK
jgi:hypothetical protein